MCQSNISMKKTASLLILFSLLLSCAPAPALEGPLYEGWTLTAPFTRAVSNDFSDAGEVSAEAERLFAAYRQQRVGRKNELTSGRIGINGYTMELSVKTIGVPDANGYPIFINLHGGGGTAGQEEQYRYMVEMDTSDIRSGLYVVPRGIIMGGEEHYWPESFLFYDRIIEDCVLFHGGDPNRVYLMGFSSGGDGVYAVAPRMADRFAAVDMCAGATTTFLFGNLRNLPTRIRVGELDAAFGRNRRAAQADALLNALAARYGGYTHQTMLYVRDGHNGWNGENGKSRVYTGENVSKWLNGEKPRSTVTDSRDFPWLSGFTRDPLPQRVVWQTAAFAGLRRFRGLYWLDRDGLLRDTTVAVRYDRADNSVTIEECDAVSGTLKILLNPDMLDVFRPVTVRLGSRQVTVQPVVSRQIMQNTLEVRGDIHLIFTSEIDVTFDEHARTISVRPVPSYGADYSALDPEKLLRWNDEGVFFADESLFGLTRDQIADRLGVSLPDPQPWPYFGDHMTVTSFYAADQAANVIILFRDGACVYLYAETEGAVSARLADAVRRAYTFTWHVLTDGGLAYYYLENNPYDGREHTVQVCQSIYFWIPRDFVNGNGLD